MLQKLADHIQLNFPFLKGKKLLVAISGGVDSVVLTELLLQLNFEVSLAHCNFKLRGGESDLDADFVKELAEKHRISCFVTAFDTQKVAQEQKESTQVAARNLRYNWFADLVKAHHFDYVLTAHHADDNIETFLIHLSRGSGLEGFTGIPAINGAVLRLLLPFSRTEIITYANDHQIVWREDQSNASTKYVRNKIRHQIVPVLKEINESFLETFSKTLDNLQESQQLIEDRMAEISSNIVEVEGQLVKFDIAKILELSNPKAYLFQLLKGYHFTEFKDVVSLLTAQSGKQVFSKTHVLLKDRQYLLLSKIERNKDVGFFYISENQQKITEPIVMEFSTDVDLCKNDKNTICIAKNALKFPLILRKWKDGDVFYPSGMQGKKKLSKYFKDEKLSRLEKEQVWLLCNNNDQIVWVINKRQDQRFMPKSTADTLKVTCL